MCASITSSARRARTVGFFGLAIVLGALVHILDEEPDGGPGGDLAALVVGHDAGQDLHLVRLLPLGGEAGLAGAAPVQIDLEIRRLQRNQRGAANHDAADGRAVALAPGGDAEQMTESVM